MTSFYLTQATNLADAAHGAIEMGASTSDTDRLIALAQVYAILELADAVRVRPDHEGGQGRTPGPRHDA